MPVAPDLVWQDVGDLDPNYLQTLKVGVRERERERKYHVSVLKMLLVRIGFCTTVLMLCKLSTSCPNVNLTKHSFLDSIRI